MLRCRSMAKKRGRAPSKYNVKTTPGEFLELCRQGKSLTQIATKLGVLESEILSWTRKRDTTFKYAFEHGRQAYKAYHEDLLDKMIRKEVNASSAEINAQIYILKVKFKEEWSEKIEPQKIEVS